MNCVKKSKSKNLELTIKLGSGKLLTVTLPVTQNSNSDEILALLSDNNNDKKTLLVKSNNESSSPSGPSGKPPGSKSGSRSMRPNPHRTAPRVVKGNPGNPAGGNGNDSVSGAGQL